MSNERIDFSVYKDHADEIGLRVMEIQLYQRHELALLSKGDV